MKAVTDPDAIHALLEGEVLPAVQQPAQYIGGEVGSVCKDPASVEVSLALAFPDLYSVGMSNLGLQVLYSLVNELDWACAERAFAPWPDMQREMAARGIPLYALESFRPVRDFDVVGVSLQTEILYVNTLLLLELAGIPVRAADRADSDPLVIAGGPATVNPEPMAPFIDLFLIGDGEVSLVPLLELVRRAKREGLGRADVIREAAKTVPGAYAPSLYEPRYGDDGRLAAAEPTAPDVPARVRAARCDELESAHEPLRPIVPFVETVHDRITLEVLRGCTHGCRFCQAGMIARPVRARSVDRLVEDAATVYAATGQDEIALCSLSTSDHPELADLLRRLTDRFSPLGVSLSLPSLRVSDQLEMLVGPLSRVRKSGLTIAPEAATERLRAVINKDITDDELLAGTAAAAREGWRTIKLYFMLGLPTETDEDAAAIPALCDRIRRNAAGEPGGKSLAINVTLSHFVPKAHTPFQWAAMAAPETVRERIGLVRDGSRSRKVKFKAHDAERSVVEGVLARGDRRLADVLERVRELGGMFDGWQEHFDFARWARALADCGMPWDDATCPNSPLRERTEDKVLPWDHIDCGVTKDFLREELARAERAEFTDDCRTGECRACGACARGEAR